VTEEEAILRLRAAGCVFAEDEAAVLTGVAPGGRALAALVERRCAGEPLEQVVGFADFCGVRVRLRPGVFVPRLRSELLVRVATEELRGRARNDARVTGETHRAAGDDATVTAGEQPAAGGTGQHPGPLVVDLCCGSGALGLAVREKVSGIDLHAADLDPVAVACATDNLGANVHHGDLFTALPPELRGRIDVLLANVPYVATRHLPFLPAEARDHEPRTALDGGDDGLTILRAVLAGAGTWLAPGGLLLSEITEAQATAACDAVAGNGLTPAVVTDDDLDARVITARR
jgi:release factor glutamine methyltransferase